MIFILIPILLILRAFLFSPIRLLLFLLLFQRLQNEFQVLLGLPVFRDNGESLAIEFGGLLQRFFSIGRIPQVVVDLCFQFRVVGL